MKKSFTFAILLLLSLSLCLIVYVYYLYETKPMNKVEDQPTENRYVTPYKLHAYDYIIEVDGSDSTLVYQVYDYNHRFIGQVKAWDLDQLIIKDNL